LALWLSAPVPPPARAPIPLKKASRTPELLILPDRVDIDLTVLRRLEKADPTPSGLLGQVRLHAVC
jgi:hypothetical protein